MATIHAPSTLFLCWLQAFLLAGGDTRQFSRFEDDIKVSCSSTDWEACGGSQNCILKSQVCDGSTDCAGGWDEDPVVCARWFCRFGTRCEKSDICIPIPHLSLCTGSSHPRPSCPDGSDQAYCLYTVYTGAFVNTSLGLRIASQSECFCDLKDEAGARLFYKSVGRTHRSSHILAKICLLRSDSRMCDGHVDCMNGEDEEEEVCHTSAASGNLLNQQSAARVGRDMDLTHFRVQESGDPIHAETADPSLGRQETGDGLLRGEDTISLNLPLDLNMLVVIFAATVVSVLVFCLVIVFVMIKLSQRNSKGGEASPSHPSFHRQVSTGSTNLYVAAPSTPATKRSATWSLRTTNIVKELGRGYYSKVYLAQDSKHGLVAMKTTDSQKSNSDDCLANEIDVLSQLEPHVHVVRLIGQNLDEKLLILEYCFHGNLRDYVTRQREYFINELDSDTQELQEEALLYRSPAGSEANLPVADLLNSMHAQVEAASQRERWQNTSLQHIQQEQERQQASRRCGLPLVRMSQTLLTTRRLLYWAYQIAKGLQYLTEKGIIHRDIALRNTLLTSSDIVKISDFGLAARPAPESKGDRQKQRLQYWSRSNKPLPFKWMALESFLENLFSDKSDVWAFGVTLWELFTLGGEPYGESSPAALEKLLLGGDRLQVCPLAPTRVNTLMAHCWLASPADRPDFKIVTESLSAYIGREGRAEVREDRSRIDSGVGDVDGYIDMSSTPRSSGFCTSSSTPSTSKYSTRSSTRSCLLHPNHHLQHQLPEADQQLVLQQDLDHSIRASEQASEITYGKILPNMRRESSDDRAIYTNSMENKLQRYLDSNDDTSLNPRKHPDGGDQQHQYQDLTSVRLQHCLEYREPKPSVSRAGKFYWSNYKVLHGVKRQETVA